MANFLKILIFLSPILTMENEYEDLLSGLETEDTDQAVRREKLISKYFANKYKIYTFEDLRQFYYEYILRDP